MSRLLEIRAKGERAHPIPCSSGSSATGRKPLDKKVIGEFNRELGRAEE